MAEIFKLPNVATTPAMMIAMLQGWSDKIESLVVVVGWRESGPQVCWTEQKTIDLALARTAVDVVIGAEIRDYVLRVQYDR